MSSLFEGYVFETLEETRVGMLDFGCELLSRRLGGKTIKEEDLTLLVEQDVVTAARYNHEWKDKGNIQEVDAWLENGGFDYIVERFKMEEVRWLADFVLFFRETWEDTDKYNPKMIDFAVYHQVRGPEELEGCPDDTMALDRAFRMWWTWYEANKEIERLSERFSTEGTKTG